MSTTKKNISKGANALIAYTSPFRLVYKDCKDEWSASYDDLINSEYDYVKLHRLSTSFDVGLPKPFCLHIGFDGSLILPAIDQFYPLEKAVSAFNQVIGEMLIGGVYYDSIKLKDIGTGFFYLTGYVRPLNLPKTLNANLLSTLKTKTAGELHRLELLDPNHISAKELHKARDVGMEICNRIKKLSVAYVLCGVEHLIEHDWSTSLSNFWISVEQLISFLWDKKIIKEKRQSEIIIIGRKDFLKDTRTWTTSTRIELLFQKSLIDDATYQYLNLARKARNALVHDGKLPDKTASEAAFDSVFRLISIIITENERPNKFEELLKKYKSMDPIQKRRKKTKIIPVSEATGVFLGPLPSLPGEPEWGDEKYEKVYPDHIDTFNKKN